MYRIFSGIFLGWALGANDSANVFGTAVSSKMIKYRIAVLLTAFFVILGAILQGRQGLHTLSGLTTQSQLTAFITSLAAAMTVTIMTISKLPISTSQAVVGAILGIGIMTDQLNLTGLFKIILCWIGTPFGGIIFSVLFYKIFQFVFRLLKPTLFLTDSILKIGLVLAGCYGAYALGANNVANVTGVYVGNLLTPLQAVSIGGISIALGVITFSKNVMLTVGKSIVKLDAFSALVVVLGQAVTVHIYALIGVPVSTSQAVVGAVLGIGLLKGLHLVNIKNALKVFSGWGLTPVLSAFFSIVIYFVMHLKYIP
ncbi:MAG: inorganic phosphate transporter family protein [Spirochaetes bacterium]|nr:inorganic phosphate transporter family protein [Spirochaetota bacterium]